MHTLFTNFPRLIVLLVAAASVGCAASGKQYPATSADGLQRVDRAGFDAFYQRAEGSADTKVSSALASYRKIMLADAQVEFRKNWLRDQNSQRSGIRRVDGDDMARIREMVAGEFARVFAKELEAKGGYAIVDSPGDDVLLLKPLIRDLDIRSPDIRAPGRDRSFVTSAGEMTLELELYAAGDTLIGRIIDEGRDFDDDIVEISSSVSNRFETARIMRRWARNLRAVLDAERS